MPDFNSVEEVLEELPSGSMVVLVDERGQDVDGTELVGEGELVTLAETVTPQTINFMARHAGGQRRAPGGPWTQAGHRRSWPPRSRGDGFG